MTESTEPLHADVRARLRTGLRESMRARDSAAVSAIRSALAALDNAEAVNVPEDVTVTTEGEHVVSAAMGVGAAEAQRAELTDADVTGILQREVDERRAAAREYADAGRADAAERLEAEVATLVRYLDG
jgi:uncharacterized protein YqeY